MNIKWKWLALGYVWALPTTIIGLTLASVFWKAKSWRWCDGCLECVSESIWTDPAAITFGWLVVYDYKAPIVDGPNEESPYREKIASMLAAHERVHTLQCFVLGPLFLPVYGLLHLVGTIRAAVKGEPRKYWFYSAYQWNPMEAQAERVSGY
ncbi:MAG: hypothetical protein IPL79_20070 [Myxococcales bacterium]|nr:hypothetical protein [Myxococcales bacterium]